MNSSGRFALTCFCLFSLGGPATRARAEVVVRAQEVGSSVVFSYSGSLDLSSLGAAGIGDARGEIHPAAAKMEFGPATEALGATDLYPFAVISAPPHFGAGGLRYAGSSAGHFFGVGEDHLEVPSFYATGNPLSGTMTFEGATFASLGLNPAVTTSVWILSNLDKVSLTLVVPPSQVDNRAKIRALQKKARILKRRIKVARKSDKAALAKRLEKTLRRTNRQIKRLRS